MSILDRFAQSNGQLTISLRDNPIRAAVLTYMIVLCPHMLVLLALDQVFHVSLTSLNWILLGTAWPAVAVLLWTAWRLRREGYRPAISFAPYGQGIVTLLMFGVWAIGYFLIKKFLDYNALHSFDFALERRIPFAVNWTFVYLGLYPMYFIPLVLIRDDMAYKKAAVSYLAVMGICWPIFLLYPVTMVRPEFAVTDFATWVLDVIYRADTPPVNCLPSMHVAMVLMCGLVLWEVHRGWGALALAYAFSIAASTVLTKQHYVVDSVASMATVTVVYLAVYRFGAFERTAHYGREWWDRYASRIANLR